MGARSSYGSSSWRIQLLNQIFRYFMMRVCIPITFHCTGRHSFPNISFSIILSGCIGDFPLHSDKIANRNTSREGRFVPAHGLRGQSQSGRSYSDALVSGVPQIITQQGAESSGQKQGLSISLTSFPLP